MTDRSLRHQYGDLLMDQIRSCRYPSVSMMDRFEESVGDRESAAEYVELLLETLRADQYPSPTLLDRVARLLAALEPVGGD